MAHKGKLKEREETLFIRAVVRTLEDKDHKEILMNSKRAGFMLFPHHYLITADGTVTKMRPEKSVANGELSNYDTTVAVLSDSTDKALASLKVLTEALLETYKGAELIEV